MSSTGSRVGTLRLVGGRPCLDLVNTVSWRGAPERREDHLVDADAALVWCTRAGVLGADEAAALRARVAGGPGAGERLVRALRRLRDRLDAALVEREAPDLEALQPVVDDALRHSRLVRADGGAVRWEVGDLEPELPARRVALDLYALLRHPAGRLGACADPQCRWVFLDTSRRQDRRWCSSADCGNRARVRRHQQAHGPTGG